MKELNNFSFLTTYKTFSVDKNFIVCYTNIHIYNNNNNIYMFNSKTGKLYIIE